MAPGPGETKIWTGMSLGFGCFFLGEAREEEEEEGATAPPSNWGILMKDSGWEVSTHRFEALGTALVRGVFKTN